MNKKQEPSESATACIECPFCTKTEWDALDAAEHELLEKAKRIEQYNPGDTLFFQGEEGSGVYCVKSGLIGLRRVDSNGNSVLLQLIDEGTTVGYRTFITCEPHSSSAEVLSPTRVCYFARPQIEQVLQTNPRLGEKFLQHFTRDAVETENSYVKSMTRGELAELVGVRPESISRLIDKLQSDDVMHFSQRRVRFSDLDRVRAEAGVEV